MAEYEAGGTARGLARKHGLRRTTVVRVLGQAGIKTGQRRLFNSNDSVVEVPRTSRTGAVAEGDRQARWHLAPIDVPTAGNQPRQLAYEQRADAGGKAGCPSQGQGF